MSFQPKDKIVLVQFKHVFLVFFVFLITVQAAHLELAYHMTLWLQLIHAGEKLPMRSRRPHQLIAFNIAELKEKSL